MWRDTPILLCFGRERYVVIDERGPTRGSVAWTARDDGAWSLRVGAGATLELHLDREGAVVRRRMSDETRSARLYRVEAARARAILARVGAP